MSGVLTGLALAIVGVSILWNGFGLAANGGLAFLIFGFAMALGGPLIVFAVLTGKRGGYGPCPVCQTKLTAPYGDSRNLLCHKCRTYVDVAGDKLVTASLNQVTKEASNGFAAPTPWPEINVASGETISLATSVKDYLMDKAQELLLRRDGIRVMQAQWPSGCCVCGKPATRREPFAKRVKYADATSALKAIDHTATLVAPNVPYCAEHRDGVDFGNVSFATGSNYFSYGVFFRSLAYREAFRKLNPWPWAGMERPLAPK